MQQKASLLSINWRDAAYSVLMAFLGALIAGVEQLINNGHIPTTWVELKPVVITAIGSAVAYIAKNFFSNSAGNFAQSESKAPAVVTIPKAESNATIETITTVTK